MYYTKNTLYEMLKDGWTYVGMGGTMLMVAYDWIETHVNPIVALVGALLGLCMLIAGIIEKINNNRLLIAKIHEAEENAKDAKERHAASRARRSKESKTDEDDK